MGQISIGTPIDISLIKCCKCGKGYDFKGNLYKDNILICPHCKLTHKIDFKLFDNKTENLKRIDRLNLTAIDIGSAAEDRAVYNGYGQTYVDKNNAADFTGKITSVQIWAHKNMTGCEVATFYEVTGNNLSTRDTESIGNVTAGATRTFTVDLDVEAGDWIGIYFAGGEIDKADTGGGVWSCAGDKIPCTNTSFTLTANRTHSIYGIGATAGATQKLTGTSVSVITSNAGVLTLGVTEKLSGTAVNTLTTVSNIKWSGLGMGGVWSTTDTSLFDGVVDTLIANGFTELRIDIPTYTSATWLARSKAAIIRAITNYPTIKIIWGVSSNGTTITSTNWATYRQAILDAAQWAQDNGVFEFQLGNDEEYHNDDDTLTDAQLITNLLSVATEVQAIFIRGNVSYSCFSDNIGDWVTAGKGDLDILASNVYMQYGAAQPEPWKDNIDALVGAFGVSGTYLTEFAPNSSSLDDYSTDEAVQAAAVTEELDYIKASGMTRAIFYNYDDDGDGFGAWNVDHYRLLWNSLLNSDSGGLGITLSLLGTSVNAVTCNAGELTVIVSGVVQKLSGTSVNSIVANSLLCLTYHMTGTSAAYVEAVAGFLDITYFLSGTSVNAISTTGALTTGITEKLSGTSTNIVDTIGIINIVYPLSGTSVNVVSTTGSVGIVAKLSGTSVSSLTIEGAIDKVKKLSGTSVNTITSNAGVLTTPTRHKLVGTSVNAITCNAGILLVNYRYRLVGTSVNIISVVANYLGLIRHLVGISVNEISTIAKLKTPKWEKETEVTGTWLSEDNVTDIWTGGGNVIDVWTKQNNVTDTWQPVRKYTPVYQDNSLNEE